MRFHFSLQSIFALVGTHDFISRVWKSLWRTQITKAVLQLSYDALGYAQGKVTNGDWSVFGQFSFNKAHPFEGTTGNYDSSKKAIFEHSDEVDAISGEKKVTKVKKVEGDEEKASEDPLNDEDKNPCIEHAYLHKSIIQADGIGVEVVLQEPDPRYVECYDRQKERQKREKLRELRRLNCCVDQSLKTSVQRRSGRRIFGMG